jgi:drug/metabolite transporter (DMT)-like permease
MTWILLAVMVISTVLGDLLQSYEMKQGGAHSVNARGLLSLVQMIGKRWPLAISIFCMAISFFAFMALLQRAPMSFAVPASAATVVLETVLAKFFLREHVGKRRWAGALLVAVGVVLLAR